MVLPKTVFIYLSMRLSWNLQLVLLISVTLSSCSYHEVKKEAPEINEIPANSKFTIILPEDHTTGYLWQLKQDYDKTVISQINEVWHGNDRGIYFNINALSAGQTTLTFVSRMYQDTAVVKFYIVKIQGH